MKYQNPFNQKLFSCYLTCPRGLEEVTCDNIRPYCESVSIDRGGVQFFGDLRSLYSVNLYSRTGMYALVNIIKFKAKDNEDLYKKVFSYPWHEWIQTNDTISIRARVRSRNFSNADFASLKVKDAIVDQIRKKTGNRPDVDKTNPIYSLFLFIHEDKVSIYLNSSGISLSKRGYREKIHKASINEALAAGIILLSDWDKKKPFYDPMCGSGTFPIEAALISRNIPAGYYRKGYALQKWRTFNNRLWNQIVSSARDGILKQGAKIYGYDFLYNNIDLSKNNSRRILIHNYIDFKKAELNDFFPEEPGHIIMNPPYGDRIGDKDELIELYESIGNVLKSKCKNSNAYIFTGDMNIAKSIGLKPKRKFVLKNGRIDCRLLHFPIVGGEYKD